MMEKMSICGNPFVGLFGFSTERQTFVRPDIGKKRGMIEDALKTEVVETTVAGTDLVGLFGCGNSNGIVVPYFIEREELKRMEGTPVTRLMQKYTALANLLVCNDFGCVASPLLDKKSLEDALGVPVEHHEVEGFKNIGAISFATNDVVYVAPDMAEEDTEFISETLRVPAGRATANMGVPYLRSCILGNSCGLVVGELTTGIEMNNLEDVLEVVV